MWIAAATLLIEEELGEEWHSYGLIVELGRLAMLLLILDPKMLDLTCQVPVFRLLSLQRQGH